MVYRTLTAGTKATGLVLGFLAAFLAETQAAPITSDQARTAVGRWRTGEARPLVRQLGSDVLRVEPFNGSDGLPLYYVVYLNPQGFVIVPADDQVEPIIAFSSHGTYDPSPGNPLGTLVSRDLAGRVQFVRAASGKAATSQALASTTEAPVAKWSRLTAAETSSLAYAKATLSDIRVAPLIQSRWDQTGVGLSSCYNYYTPSNYPCGCVATAMAQIMRFYQYPTSGIGVHSFTIEVNNHSQAASTRGGNGTGGPYDWSSMPLIPTSAMTSTQRQAIGALCYDAGVSVNMSYAAGGSGAAIEDVRTALRSTFGYSNAVFGFNMGNELGSALTAMLNPNLDAGAPVLLGIDNYQDEGHAIVADGYGYDLSTLYHHLNMGWSGSDDAWYNLPNVGTQFNFTIVNACVYNIFVSGTGEIISGRVTDNATTAPVTGATVTAQTSGGMIYTATTNDRGIYALARIPAGTTYTLTAAKSGYTFTTQTVTTGISTSGGVTSGNRWAVNFRGTSDHTLAVADSVATLQDTAIVIPVLANDNASGGGTLTIQSFTQGSHGSVAAAANAALTYTPALHYTGTDTFSYTVSNGTVTDSAAVTVLVTATPTPPLAVDDQLIAVIDTTTTLDVLANDSDPHQNTLTLVSVTAPGHGTAAVSLDHRTVLYTPTQGYRGDDNFTYIVSNGSLTASAKVSVTVASASYTLTTKIVGQGRVSPSSGTFVGGTTVALQATPSDGYQIRRWHGTDNDSSTDPANSVTLRAATTVTVTFGAVEYSWTAAVNGGHGSLWPTQGTSPVNTTVTLIAYPDPGYRVKQWTGTDHDTSAANANSVTITQAGQQMTVEFETTSTAVPAPSASGTTTTGTSAPLAPLGCGRFGGEFLVLILFVLLKATCFCSPCLRDGQE